MTTTFDRHTWCLETLPAFVGGTLPPHDSAAVLAHADECAQCRAELGFARRVHGHFDREWSSVAPLLDAEREQAGFDQLWSRISADEVVSPAARRRVPQLVLSLTALAATIGLGVGLLWYQNAAAPDYHTLADSPPRVCGQLRVQVGQQRPAADIVRLLESAGTQVVDGPSAEGVYTLRAANAAESLRRLRALPDVRLAEPTDC
jgi:anti-sigma factor RsiW